MFEEYFSAAASAKAKEKGALTKYRAYKVGTYFDKISERYNFVDIFELQAFHVPLNFDTIKHYSENPEEHPLTPAGKDNHIIRLSREAYSADQGADHVLLPVQLTAKRYTFVSSEDLQDWEEESKEEGINFVGAIPNIAPVRDILERTGEAGLIHQVTSDKDARVREKTDSSGRFLSATDAGFYYDYQEDFTPVGPCGHFECPVCYNPLTHYDKPRIFLISYPEDAPEVVAVRVKDAKQKKLQHLTKLARMSELLTMLSKMTDSMEAVDAIDSPNLDDYYDQLQ